MVPLNDGHTLLDTMFLFCCLSPPLPFLFALLLVPPSLLFLFLGPFVPPLAPFWSPQAPSRARNIVINNEK